MAKILLLGAKVPFTSGGQDVLLQTLKKELILREHTVDVVELPYNPLPKENLLNQVALWRSLNLEFFAGTHSDLVIATKFPSYFVRHSRKSVWLVHQHRPIYDLYGGRYSDFSDDPRDEELRRILVDADTKVLAESSYISSISQNVAQRLQRFNQLKSTVLYPPLPQGNKYSCIGFEPYILSVGRICSPKRVDLMVKAMPHIPSPFVLKIVGVADEPGIMDYLKNEISKHSLQERVEFLGRVSDEELLKLYSKAYCVYYAPHDEDYGYVTVEAMASGKAVITASDSGGVLEFVKDGENGLVCSPTIESIAQGVIKLISDRNLCVQLGKNGVTMVQDSKLSESN